MGLPILLLSVFLVSNANCNVIEEVMEWIAHEEYFEFFCQQETQVPLALLIERFSGAEDTMEEFFIHFPSLKPSDRAEVIELKRSFVQFMDLDPVELQTELIAASSTKHTSLSRFIDDLKDLVREEFNNLTAEDKSYLETFDAFVQHKLILEPGLKDIKQKKAEFLESGLSKAEFTAEVMRKCDTISHRWNMDPGYVMAEDAFNTPEVEEAIRKYQESSEEGNDEMLSIHIDGQTKEKKIKTVKLNNEL